MTVMFFAIWPWLAGLAVTMLAGPLIAALVRRARRDLGATAPDGIPKEKWEAVVASPNLLGPWLGRLERAFFFVALAIGSPALVAGWLVFKVGSKWEVFQNIVKVPDKLEGVDSLSYLKARHVWASAVLQAFLLGTLGNILAALAGVGLARLALDSLAES